jgi:hypothetical protein
MVSSCLAHYGFRRIPVPLIADTGRFALEGDGVPMVATLALPR